MRTNSLPTPLSLIIILFIMATTASGAVITGDIYLIDGTEYLGVKMTVNDTYKIIKIESSEAKKSVSFHRIARILDYKGYDITRSLIGRDSREPARKSPIQENVTQENPHNDSSSVSVTEKSSPDKKPALTTKAKVSSKKDWLSDTDPKILDYNRRLWSVALWSHGTYSSPMGYYYDDINAGSNLGFGLSIAISRKLALRFDIERSGIQPGNAFNLVSINPAEVEIVSQRHEMTANRYLIGIQIINQTSEPGETLKMFHATTGLGAISQDFRSTVTLREVSSGIVETFSGKINESKFMTYIGGAFVLGVSETVGIDIGLNLDLLFIGSDGNGQIQYAYILDLRFGLVFLIK